MYRSRHRTSIGWLTLGACAAVSACLAPKYTEGDPFGSASGANAGATNGNVAGNAPRAGGGSSASSMLQNKAGSSGTTGGMVGSMVGGSSTVLESGGANFGGINAAAAGSASSATSGAAGTGNTSPTTAGAASGAAAGRANGGSSAYGGSALGTTATGGTSSSYGGAATGGKAATGGATATGGAVVVATGGAVVVATGGRPPTGGAPATGGVPPYIKPTITQEPQDSTVCLGTQASFSIAATGTGTPLTYQWYQLVASESYKLGAGPSLTISTSPGPGSPTPPFSNQYYCVVTDSGGFSTTSRTATLLVPNPPAYNVWNWGIDAESTAVPHLWVQLDPPASGCIHYVYSNNGVGFTILQTGVCAGEGQAWPNVGMPPDYNTVSNNIVQVISIEGTSGLACETRSTWVWNGSTP